MKRRAAFHSPPESDPAPFQSPQFRRPGRAGSCHRPPKCAELRRQSSLLFLQIELGSRRLAQQPPGDRALPCVEKADRGTAQHCRRLRRTLPQGNHGRSGTGRNDRTILSHQAEPGQLHTADRRTPGLILSPAPSPKQGAGNLTRKRRPLAVAQWHKPASRQCVDGKPDLAGIPVPVRRTRPHAVRPIGRGAVCPDEPPTWQINPQRAASRVA